MTNPFRKALLDRKPTIGTWIQLGHPGIAEIFANAGFDWIAVDMEHTEIDISDLGNLFRGMYGRGATPVARVASNDTIAIRQALDIGAQAIFVPLVNTPDDAERAVQAAKYPPRGIRGYAFGRMNDWGTRFADYATSANDDVAVVVMIESQDGAHNIDAILEVDGVDGVFLGPYDLSGSFGRPGQVDHPTVREACRHVIARCVAHNKSAGVHIVDPTPEAIAAATDDGARLLCVGIDTVFLSDAARNVVSETKAALATIAL